MDVLEKLGTVLDTTAGLTFHGSDEDFNVNAGGYVYTFSADRALFRQHSNKQ